MEVFVIFKTVDATAVVARFLACEVAMALVGDWNLTEIALNQSVIRVNQLETLQLVKLVASFKFSIHPLTTSCNHEV